MKLTVTTQNVYGITKCYPADENAKFLAEIAGTKTLTVDALWIAARYGHEIEVQGFGEFADSLRASLTRNGGK